MPQRHPQRRPSVASQFPPAHRATRPSRPCARSSAGRATIPTARACVETPDRVVRSYDEFFSGYGQDPNEILAKTFSEVDGYDEMIVMNDIRFESHCEHHMVPIIGKAHIGYLPDRRVVGICKLARLVEVYARRLQIQEKMTVQIADTLQEVLQPEGRGGGGRGRAPVHDHARRAQARRGARHEPHARRVPQGRRRPAASSWRSSRAAAQRAAEYVRLAESRMRRGDVLIVGGGIGGLTLALCLHRAGIACRVFEQAPQFRPLGVGINILPHASAELARLGLADALARRLDPHARGRLLQPLRPAHLSRAARTRRGLRASAVLDSSRAPARRAARAVVERIGATAVVTRAGVHARDAGRNRSATAHFVDARRACPQRGDARRRLRRPALGRAQAAASARRAAAVLGREHVARRQRVAAHPHRREHDPRGWLATGKMVIYPVADDVDGDGRQLVNWVAEIETPHHTARDWNRRGELRDFIGAFADWHFDWLDVPAMIRAAESILEFPMVDQDPLPWWTQGRVTLLGDAAHPDVSARLERRGTGDPRRARARRCARFARQRGSRARGVRVGAPAVHRGGRAHESQESAGCDPARGVAAHRRQAVRAASTT